MVADPLALIDGLLFRAGWAWVGVRRRGVGGALGLGRGGWLDI